MSTWVPQTDDGLREALKSFLESPEKTERTLRELMNDFLLRQQYFKARLFLELFWELGVRTREVLHFRILEEDAIELAKRYAKSEKPEHALKFLEEYANELRSESKTGDDRNREDLPKV